MAIQRVSVDVTSEMYEKKLEKGVKWSHLINEGFKTAEYKERLANAIKMLESQGQTIVMLEEEVKRLKTTINSWHRGVSNENIN